jgi:adenine deaminase
MRGVIARLDDAAAGLTYVALVARDGRGVTGTTTRDLDVAAVATSVTADMDVLLVGRDPEALVAAYRRVVALGGGLVCPGAEVAMPTFGHLSPLPVPELAARIRVFDRVAGLPEGPPPFTYRSMFLTLPALPGICLTAEGLLDVRARRRLTEAVIV